MAQHLQTLAEYQRQGQPMSAFRVQGCRWGVKTYGSTPKINTTPDGWPIHPTLKADFSHLEGPTQKEGTLYHLHWTQPGRLSEEVIESHFASLEKCLLWPGGEMFDQSASFVLGKHSSEKIKPIERLLAYKIFQELVEKELGEGTLSVIRKLRGIKKHSAIGFLLSNLPHLPEEKRTALRNRNQFIDRNPELVHWLWNSVGENYAKLSPWRKTLQGLVDKGAGDEEITREFTGNNAWTPKTLHQIARLIQGNKGQCQNWIHLLETRRSLAKTLLEKSQDPEKDTALLRRQNQTLADKIKETDKGKISRAIPPENPQRWYVNYALPPAQQIERGDSLLCNWAIWKSQNTWKTTRAAAEKAEAKKPPQERHRVLIPDENHIFDYLLETYPQGPIPLTLSPKKMVEAIRKWETDRLEKVEEELLKDDVKISPEILAQFPSTLEGGKFKGTLLASKHAFEQESKDQKHCVRGYFDSASKGNLAVYSITTKKGARWTLEVDTNLALTQLKGENNAHPPDALEKDIENTLFEVSQARNQKSFQELDDQERLNLRAIRRKGSIVIPSKDMEEKLKPWRDCLDTSTQKTAEALSDFITAQPKRYLAIGARGALAVEIQRNSHAFFDYDIPSQQIVPYTPPTIHPPSQEREITVNAALGFGPTQNFGVSLHISDKGRLLLECIHENQTEEENLIGGENPELAVLSADLNIIPEESRALIRLRLAVELINQQIQKFTSGRKKPHEVIYLEAKSKEEAHQLANQQTTQITPVATPLARVPSQKFKESFDLEKTLFDRCQTNETTLLRVGKIAFPEEKLAIWDKIHEALQNMPISEHEKKAVTFKIENLQRDIRVSLDTRIALVPPQPEPEQHGETPPFCWVNLDVATGKSHKEVIVTSFQPPKEEAKELDPFILEV